MSKGAEKMKISEAEYKAAKKYQKEKCRTITMQLNKTLDEDILVWLDSQNNKQGYLKQLIRDDMRVSGFQLEDVKKEEEK